MSIDITYGILNYNPRNDETATTAYINAVKSLAINRSNFLKSEIYLIDQGSQPELTKKLAAEFNLNTVLLNNNVGISRGINLLANLSRGKFVSLVTSDVTFTPGIDDTLVSALRADPTIYQICPVSDNSSLEHQRNGYVSDSIMVENICQELTIQFWPRTVFNKIGYFDERWKACYENMDFALRTFLHGGKTVVHQGVFCHHEHNTTTKSGAIHTAYEDYIDMPEGFCHDPLALMWRNKWHGLDRFVTWNGLYKNISSEMRKLRTYMAVTYSDNIYLPYIQNVKY